MTLFLFSLALFSGTALCCILLALFRSSHQTARIANGIGMAGAVLGSLTGLCALFQGSFSAVIPYTLPFGLPAGSFALTLDGLSRLFLLPVFVLGLFCAISGALSLRHETPKSHNLAIHWLFYVLLLLGMTLVMTANDIVFFLLAWEVMSLAPFFLIDFYDSEQEVRDASWVYLTAAHLGAVVLLAFFVLLWQQTGQTGFFSEAVAAKTAEFSPTLRLALFFLALTGFGAKAGLVPMHIWLPEAHPAAPSHVSALLSGAMINAGLYGILRTISLLHPAASSEAWWGWVLVLLGLGSALTGMGKALAQGNVKRLLAYSSVENMGLMLLGAGVAVIGMTSDNAWLATLGLAGALFHMLNHALFKGLLFLAAGEILHATGTVTMAYLGGLQKKMPLLGLLFAIAAASIAALPPCNGFVGEYLLALALLDGPRLASAEAQTGLLLALVALAAISGFGLQLYTKAYGIVFLGQARSGFAETPHKPSTLSLLPLVFLALACILTGLFAAKLFPFVTEAMQAAFPIPAKAVALLDSTKESLTIIGLIGLCLMLLSLGIYGLRRMLLAGKEQDTNATWSCGYQAGNAHIQYSAASFSEPTARFLGSFMGLKAAITQDSAIFPQESTLRVQAPARLRRYVYTPIFQAVETLSNALKIVQHGKIHLYILYILVTLVALLVWGVN